MRRVLIGLAGLYVTLILVGATPAHAQSLPSLDEATALLKKAIDATNLKGPGVPPFHLVAKIHYVLDDKTADGMYEILYAASDRYRVQLELDGVGETDVAVGNKIYILRATPTMTYPFWSLQDFLWQPGWPFLGVRPKATRVYASTSGTEARPCLDAESEKPVIKQVCFDPASNAVVSIHVGGNPQVGDPKHVGFESDLDDFVDFRPARYPRRLHKQFFREIIDATVEKLVPVDKFADDAFTPPPNAQVRDWCASPVLGKAARPPTPTMHFIDPWLEMKDFMAIYLLVSRDGNVKNILMIHPSNNAGANAWFGGATKIARFVTHTCDGKAVEYETVTIGGAPGQF